MNTHGFLRSRRTGIRYTILNILDRGSSGNAYEVQSPRGDRTIIEPPNTADYELIPPTCRFDLGQVVATPGVLAAMQKTGERPLDFLTRHQSGDWGDLDASDRQANDTAITDGSRIFSAYHLRDRTKIYVITEAEGDGGQRESTCILLPDEY